MRTNSFILLLLLLLGWGPVQAQKKVRIACVGNSITFGHGLPQREQDSYPAQLQALLGAGYEVGNFGVSSKTVIRTGADPYMATPQYQQALQSKPDLVFIKLGTNDSRLPYRNFIDSFLSDYKTLIQAFRSLPTQPRVVLLLPVASFLQDTSRQTDAAIRKYILPRIRRVAFTEKLEVIDLYSLTVDQPGLFPDKLHPDSRGATLIARRLQEAVLGEEQQGFDIFQKIREPMTISSFRGFDCANFTFNGRSCKVVRPRRPAPGLPWVWRARFWGVEPQTDVALLERGVHVVYCDVAELFGNAEAIDLWDAFYRKMRRAGLARKACLEGFSRGGVYVYNWALANPGKVAAVYADAPVLDLKSWPGGKGQGPGSPADWETFKRHYGFATEEQALQFKGNPLDNAARLAKAGYPMLHVVGDADEVVPVAENTALFAARVKAAGGQITVIHKAGVRHHPHSLANPSPIVNFILRAVGMKGISY